MRKLLLFFLSCVFCYSSRAQENWKKKFPDADAVYTNRSCDVNIKWEDKKLIAVSEFSEKLLFLTDNSVKMMSRGSIYHSSFNELKKWEAYTQLPDDKRKLNVSNTTTTSSTEDYIFYDDAKSTSFDFTGAVIGATRHLEYQIVGKDAHLLSPFYFERYFPVAESELRIHFPSDVKIKYLIKGLHANKIAFKESKKKDKTTYSFRVTDLDDIRPYPDAPDHSYYSTHVIFFIEQVQENGAWKTFLSSPDDLYRHNYGYIKNLNKTRSAELENITDSLIKNVPTDLEKTKKIFQWVQTHIKYVAFEEGLEGFIPRDANLVCTRRFGDCKDMASILTSMLTYARIPAYITWIGTRDIPYKYTEVPLPISDNHMICTVKLGEDYIFLDATDNTCLFGYPSSDIQGKEALISINENEYKLITVPVVSKDKNMMVDSTFMEISGNRVIGKIKAELKGYYASDIQAVLKYKNNKEQEDYLKSRFYRGNNKIQFSNWKIEPMIEQETILITAHFELPDYAKKLDDEWFLNLNLFKWYEHQEIDYPKRKMPIEFDFLERSTYVTILNLPPGYKAAHVPKSDSFKNNVWGFVMNYTVTDHYISLTQKFETDHLILYHDQFEPWNKVLEHLFPNYKQTVSIRKN
jgi:transglutaminase-like putative cysteine protease